MILNEKLSVLLVIFWFMVHDLVNHYEIYV